MDEHIGIFVAWPYANGDLHLGHIAGCAGRKPHPPRIRVHHFSIEV